MIIAGVCLAAALIGAYAAYGLWEKKKRRTRRAARRVRNMAYQRLWDLIMRRPTTPRLTDQREAD